jgi:APA family basic amino acid/polyamine antiporter
MFAVSRIIAAVARQHLLPPFLAKVHKRFGTPYISTALSGVATAVIALFTSFDELLNMVRDCCCYNSDWFWMCGQL